MINFAAKVVSSSFRIFRRDQALVRGSVIPLVVARGDRNCDAASIGSHRLSCCGKTNCVPVSAPPRRPEDMLGLGRIGMRFPTFQLAKISAD